MQWNNTDQSNSIICLVFGAGLGRLVQFCIDAIKDCADYNHLGKATIYAVDANPLAVHCLTSYFSDYQPANSPQGGVLNVIVYPHPFSLFPGMQRANLPHGLVELYRNCDLIVSELLGCFGCDEFLPELTSTLCNLFLRNSDTGVCIPKCWQSYIVPIQSYDLYDSLLSDTASSTYTVGIPGDCIFMSEPKILWKGSCYDYQTPCNLEGVKFPYSPFMVKDSNKVAKLLSLENVSDDTTPSDHLFVIHGIIGYFTSYLYDDIYIDTRHCSERNAFHWECFYMPIRQPSSLPIQGTGTLPLNNESIAVCVSVNRTCAIIKPSNSDTGICGRSSSAGIRNDARLSLCYSWKIEYLSCNGRQEEHIVNRSWEAGNAIFLSY